MARPGLLRGAANIRMEGAELHRLGLLAVHGGQLPREIPAPADCGAGGGGQRAKADFLRGEWEKNVSTSSTTTPGQFASEMPIDSTAYESTCGRELRDRARAEARHESLVRPQRQPVVLHPAIEPRRHEDFLVRQHLANLACRGVAGGQLLVAGQRLSRMLQRQLHAQYMSQMGGWALLDYALRHDANPPRTFDWNTPRCSARALMNSGDAGSNYGTGPGALHDGR